MEAVMLSSLSVYISMSDESVSFHVGPWSLYCWLSGPGEPAENGEMNQMTIPSRHRIQISSPGGLLPSTLPLGHGGSPTQILNVLEWAGTKLFVWNLNTRTGQALPSHMLQVGSFNRRTRVQDRLLTLTAAPGSKTGFFRNTHVPMYISALCEHTM